MGNLRRALACPATSSPIIAKLATTKHQSEVLVLHHARPARSGLARTTAGRTLRGLSHARLGPCRTSKRPQGGIARLAPLPSHRLTRRVSRSSSSGDRSVGPPTSHTHRPKRAARLDNLVCVLPSVRTRSNRAAGACCDRVFTGLRNAASTGCRRADHLECPWLYRGTDSLVSSGLWASIPVNDLNRRRDRAAYQWESQQGRAWW
ncbi:hypothetical protein C8Q72DRAFT_2195 [Fomitopsis betulina]|nr:hypothetical protein C8Q72DRAFT_2195 [Fomitopsis betulina]